MIAPTIIIGLGGIGSDICCRVSRQVNDPDQRKRIRFVCVDTDVNDLSQRKAEDPRIITIQTSAPYMVGNYLETNTNAKENWFPTHSILMGKTPTEGAGQVRAISRLAFDEAVREGRLTALDKAIEELYFLDGAAAPQAVRVMIVSTLAGGTGSGIVLPVALYVRHFLETRFRKSASVVRGFFLLPEIMFGNKSPEECGSLCCNAYASMRELDAFMRRGDGALEGPKYKDLKLELPDASSGNYVDYPVSPFNFCFLYDKRNTDDLQLKSFDDYKEHAANTIYAQAISGMSNRSNSNEDNAIKPLIKSNGRNRFCGAGSSLLKYPRDSVLEYVAGKWCIEIMDKEWLSIDKAYLRYVADQKSLRKKNPGLKDQSLADFYVERIDHAEKGSFEEQLYNMCHIQSTDEVGNPTSDSRLDRFTAALFDYVDDEIRKDPEMIDKAASFDAEFTRVSNANKGIKDDEEEKLKGDDLNEALYGLVELGRAYVNESKAVGNRLGRTIAMQLFQDEKDFTYDNKEYRMEFYMKDEEGKFIHPNAARYFIYCLIKKFNEGLQELPKHLKSKQQDVEPFDDLETREVEDGGAYMEANIGKKRFFLFSKDKSTRADVLDMLESQHKAAPELALLLAKKAVFENGLNYFRELADSYEKFYYNFESYLKATKTSVAEIERKYVNGEGKATRYVCASEKCLKGLLEEMPCAGESSSVNGKLSASIFHEMKTYAMMVRKPNASIYFDDLYNKKIIGFWENRVENSYAALINMDVLSALEAEAEYEREENMTDDQKSRYCAQILQQAERLAAPFVEEPMGEIRHPFTICAYNPEIMGEPDSTRRSFVKANLNDQMGGQQDDNVSPYELMVYKALYNLSAGDLKRFRAPEGKDLQGGTYYAAYIDTIKLLGPDTNTNPVLTPHLDRRWHLPKFMPDLDDRNQHILETEIYTALAWGMLTGKIDQTFVRSELDEENHIIYRPASRRSSDFVVSNGTPCDELYEVVDALSINPPQVTMLLEDLEKTMKREKRDGFVLGESKLMNSLSWMDKEVAFGDDIEIDLDEDEIQAIPFRIKQYAPKQKATIFDMIYWIKAGTPVDDFSEEEIEVMLDSMLNMFEKYVEQYTGANRVYRRCFRLLEDQFKQFMVNLTDPEIRRPRHRIYDSCVSLIRDFLDYRIETKYNLSSKQEGRMREIHRRTVEAQESE